MTGPNSASSTEVFAEQAWFAHERCNLRLERNRGILATVDNLFTNTDCSQHLDPLGARGIERGPREEKQAWKEPMRKFVDLEKQSCVGEPRSGDHYRRGSTYGRAAICAMMLIAAFAWQYYTLVHN